jgi:hypothetical protein
LAYTGPQRVHFSPGEYVIRVFGGVRKLARILGMTPTAVYLWQKKRNPKNPFGLVPSKKQREILNLAKERGLDLTADDLIYGRFVIED